MSWSSRYGKEYKTSNPNLIITAVCSFPNIYNTLDKVIKLYDVKALQKDSILLDIMSDYNISRGCNFTPFYFEDDCPKLAKLQKLNPVGKSFFWCIGYRNPRLVITSKSTSTWNGPQHIGRRQQFEWWITNKGYNPHHGVSQYLFKDCIDTWVYEQSKNLIEDLHNRRFQLTANSGLRNSPETGEECLKYLDKMYLTNWYQFVFEAYRARY